MSETNPLDLFAMFHVWIHSNAETGKPDSIDVFEIIGKVHMQWFTDALQKDNGPELAELFYEHLHKTEDSAWFIVRMCQDNAEGITDHYAKVVALAT